MQPILFIVYLVLFCWLITRVAFFKNAPIHKWLLIALFLLKVIAGVAYAWYFAQPQYINNADTWNYYSASLAETDCLLRNPLAFIKDLFHNNYNSTGNLFNNQSSYWNDLKSNFIIKLIAVINVFTAKSYYTNIIFFNFVYLFGPVALYRLATSVYPQQKMLFIFPVFLLPSFLFWCSGVHKDGLIFSAMMLVAYSFSKQLQQHRLMPVHCVLIVLYCIILFALRNFVLLLLIPALIAWALSEKYSRSKAAIFGGIYLGCIVVFFTAKFVHPALNFPAYVLEKQAEFKTLAGNSRVNLPPLVPTFAGFFSFLPYAADMAFLQPHWSEIKNISYAASATENTLLLLLLIVGLISIFLYRKITPFALFLVCIGLSLLLLCGYTVTFAGAVVRYKSLATPLLATAMCTFLIPAIQKHQNKL